MTDRSNRPRIAFLGFAFQQKLKRFSDKFLRLGGSSRKPRVVLRIERDLVSGFTFRLDHADEEMGCVQFFHCNFHWHAFTPYFEIRRKM